MTRNPGLPPWSVLLVVSHDIAPRHGCYGGQAVTPHIDALAAEGTRFENHFCQWPLCGPSRANLFTGCRPLTTGRFNNDPFFPEFRTRMGPEFMSLPECFRRSGYTTAGAGLVYHDVDDAPSWDQPLFRAPALNGTAARWDDLPRSLVVGDNKEWVTDHAYEVIRDRWQMLLAQGYTERDLQDPTIARRAQGPAVEIAYGDDDVYSDGIVTSHAIGLLQDAPRDKPFFITVGFITGHTPFRAPERYWNLYDRDTLRMPAFDQLPAGSPPWVAGDSEPSQYYTRHGYEQPWRASPKQARELMHGHLAAMSYTDAQVGRLVDALRKTGRYDTTVIVVVSDHGFHDGQHGYWGKHNLWDQSLRTPLVMRVPPGGGARTATGTVHALTEQVDIYPTLCELCGIPVPEFLEGESFVPVLESRDVPGKNAVFAHRTHMWHDRIKAYHIAHTVRTHRYRYTEYLDEGNRPVYRELFDYQEDPDERINHVARPGNRAVTEELAGMLKQVVAGGA